jgi:hypothetical protein
MRLTFVEDVWRTMGNFVFARRALRSRIIFSHAEVKFTSAFFTLARSFALALVSLESQDAAVATAAALPGEL